MKIPEPIIYEIGYKTYQVNDRGMDSFYVLVGNERGLVIDCGSGSFDTRAVIEKLCPLPYDVAIGHAHGDHCGACTQWEQVWLHPGDFETINDNYRVNEQLWENPNIWRTGANHKVRWPDGSVYEWEMMEHGAKELFDYSNFRFIGVNPKKMPELIPMEDGHIFDLGGRQVRVLHLPGHSPGSCVFIDNGARIAYTTDAFYQLCYCRGLSVNSALKNLLKFKSFEGDFDRIYYGHTSCACCLSNFSLSKQALDDAIDLYRGIVRGTCEYTTALKNGVVVGNASNGLIVNFTFDPSRIIDEGEDLV